MRHLCNLNEKKWLFELFGGSWKLKWSPWNSYTKKISEMNKNFFFFTSMTSTDRFPPALALPTMHSTHTSLPEFPKAFSPWKIPAGKPPDLLPTF